VKGTIHWVSASHCVDAEVRLYDRLFRVEEPESLDDLNPESLVVLRGAKLEPAAAAAKPGDRYQLERQGYFCVDITSKPDALVLNRTVTLRDTWAKLIAREEPPSVPPDMRPTEPVPASVPYTKRTTRRDVGLTLKERERAARYLAIGLEDKVAFQLAQRADLADLFEAALDAGRPFDPKSIANLTIHDVARELKQRGSLPFGGREIAELAELIEDGTLSSGLAKEVLAEMAASGGRPRDIVATRGLQRLSSTDEVEPIVEAVLAENAEPVARYRAGKTGLFGFFVGQVMKRTGGKADAALVQKLLAQKLN
jgi:glutaminyl-tRNA synthetase